MQLYNSLTKKLDDFNVIDNTIKIYTCGPTVYSDLTIGNLSAFIYSDLLRRVLEVIFPATNIVHVMNITDVDDKTIRDSKGTCEDPMQALLEYTRKYETIFKRDLEKVGNQLDAYTFIRATDCIDDMQALISSLYDKGMAYITDDGVYFSISAYKNAGKTYGQLVDISINSLSHSRISSDEYDKDSAQDFALWKLAKKDEPAWKFNLGDKDLTGRPGWHIECSAMSRKLLGNSFDIHSGGVDLKFPHHENEIAQSTACSDSKIMARWFVHNDHMLVDGIKMSKSLKNFFTLRDIEARDIEPLAFRLLVLQGHYRNSVNFTWENLENAQERLHKWRAVACIRWQTSLRQTKEISKTKTVNDLSADIISALSTDLKTPAAIADIEKYINLLEHHIAIGELDHEDMATVSMFFETIDALFGLQILDSTPNISSDTESLLEQRKIARINKDYTKSDILRTELISHKIEVKDCINDLQIWSYL